MESSPFTLIGISPEGEPTLCNSQAEFRAIFWGADGTTEIISRTMDGRTDSMKFEIVLKILKISINFQNFLSYNL